MLKTSRLNAIRRILQENGRVDVASLSKEFGVSSVTIRHNLDELEKEGVLIRTYGGATLPKSSSFTDLLPTNSSAAGESALDKRIRVAQIAAKLVPDNAWVYLGAGQTCYEMSKFLLERNVNIVTGGLPTALLLCESKTLSVFVPGGNLIKTREYPFLSGDWFCNTLDNLSMDIAFVGFTGIDLEMGLTINNSLEQKLIEKIREVSKKVVVLVDSTKFGRRAFMSVADLTYGDIVVTNKDIPQEYRDYFAEHHVELITD